MILDLLTDLNRKYELSKLRENLKHNPKVQRNLDNSCAEKAILIRIAPKGLQRACDTNTIQK